MPDNKGKVKIDIERFENALKMANYNKSKLSREMQSITHRSLLRNLQEGYMQYGTLLEICQILDVSVDYITGKDKFKPSHDYISKFSLDENRIDPSGYYISDLGSYTVYKNEEERDKEFYRIFHEYVTALNELVHFAPKRFVETHSHNMARLIHLTIREYYKEIKEDRRLHPEYYSKNNTKKKEG